MTVCIGAIANNSKAIVMVADKALTYEHLSGDSGIEKFLPIGKSGWTALLAGSIGQAEQIIKQVSIKVANDPAVAKSELTMAACIQREYQAHRAQSVSDRILRPKFLTKELLLSKSSSELPFPHEYFMDVTKEIAAFEFDCTMVICGFDVHGVPHIFSVDDPGVINSHDLEGYAAIGLGSSAAISRLLWWEVHRKIDLAEMLYFVLDAKACAEQTLSVGFGWDAVIALKGKKDVVRVRPRIKELIDRIYDKQNASPFLKNQKLPKQWQERLTEYAQKVMKLSRATKARTR